MCSEYINEHVLHCTPKRMCPKFKCESKSSMIYEASIDNKILYLVGCSYIKKLGLLNTSFQIFASISC